MGGIGSGRKYRPGEAKATVDEFPSLSISELNKPDLMEPGMVYKMGYSAGKKELGSVIITVRAGELLLNSTFNAPSQAQVVKTKKNNCHFGGSRSWIECPKCGAKRISLYYKNNIWRCRVCHELGYQVQKMSPHRRQNHMIEKIQRQKLGIKPGSEISASTRPHRMRRKTHAEILERLMLYQEKSSKHFNEWLHRMKSNINQQEKI